MEKSLKQVINPENKPIFFGVTSSNPMKNKKIKGYVLKQQPVKDYCLIDCDYIQTDEIILVETIDKYIFKVTTEKAIYLMYKYF